MSYSPHVFTKIPITNISMEYLDLVQEIVKIIKCLEVFFCLIVKTRNYFSVFCENMWWAKLEKAVHTFIVWELTLIRGSEREVHMAISSRVLMSGYLFLANSASNSWSCCEVKCVRCRLWRLSFTLFLLLLLLLLFLPEIKKKKILLISNFLKTSKRTSWSKRGWKRTDSTELRLVSKVKETKI